MYYYFYIVLYINWPFECNHDANVARDESEFDTPALDSVCR